MAKISNYTTIVLTGGYGTRLSELVPDRPKILAPIGDKPFLTYFLDWFSRSSGDTSQLILATGHMHDQILDFTQRNALSLEISFESIPVGTLGAIFNACHMINNDHILILNGDTIFDFDFQIMFRKYLALMRPLLLLKSRTNEFNDKGYVIHNERSLWVDSDSTHFSLGAFFISREYILSLLNNNFSDYQTKKYMIDSDLLSLIQPTPFVTTTHYFIDIGTPPDFINAQKEIPSMYPHL